jgi:glutaredoxin
MRLQLLATPGCVDCLALKILVDRIRPDYPELEVETIDLTPRSEMVIQYGLRRRPGVVINGRLVATHHIKEAELRRAILRRRPRRKYR